MSKSLKYQMTWCDYLTPCPYRNKEGKNDGVMVGEYDCAALCKYCVKADHENYIIRCKYEDEHIA